MKQLLCFHILTALIIYCSSSDCVKNNKIVHLNQGKIKGSFNYLGQYWSYLGVPYAEFRGRFKEPGDPPSWNGTLRANRGYISCKQCITAKHSVIGDEDCFNLNVYTPIAPSNTTAKPLSVIVFIPGGGFYKGSNTDDIYNAKYLVQKDVVVVTINYRIGAFGFLCLNNDGAPGNMGLKDQLAALRWVKNNIASFGGDPNCVTLFGQSAGASCVDYFMSTRVAEGLFHRAIMDSGTSLTPQYYDKEPILTASEAASRLGYNTTDTDELLAIFLNATADDVALVSFRTLKNDALAPYIFRPCMENPSSSNTTILTTSPEELVKSVRDISNISVIMGYNNKEGLFWAQHYSSKCGLRKLDKEFSSAVPNTFTYKKPADEVLLIKDIREIYFKNASIAYKGLIDYFSDVLIMSPSVAKMEAYLTNPNISMFNYYFTYDSQRNLRKMSKLKNITKGATHSDELLYMFDPKVYRYCPPTSDDKVMIDRMTSLWTNFAKTGVPTAHNTDDIEWPRSENTLKFLKLDKEIAVIDLPNKDRINFWKRSYETYLQT